jgi:HAE1 family hydrophobic/amphiphilic exporter-1
VSEIVLEFAWDTDMTVAQQDVRDRLDLFEPPLEVTEKPVILRYDPTLDPVLRAAITPSEAAAEDPARAYRELTTIREAAERYIKSDLEAEAGIAQVAVKGGQELEIQIFVDAERLKNLGLSLSDVVSSLAQQNINLSGGSLKEGKTEYLVRTLNEFEDVREVGRTVVTNAAGLRVRLEDVADVRLGEKDRETIVRINGLEAVELEIFKEGDANTVAVCNRLKDLLGFERKRTVTERVMERMFAQPAAAQEESTPEMRGAARAIRDHLPAGARFTLISDQSQFIQGAIEDVQASAIQGGLLALAVLYLFLREWRSTLAIGLAIPISVITVFVPMYLRDISLNVMSLGGLALGIGMLVDNSIVVLESIFRCREEGDGILQGAERGTREVAGAVIASTLTTVAVFFPIAFVEGVAGQIFSDQALTVTFSLLASLLVALVLNPMLASRQAIALDHGGGAVWLLRGYRDARATRGRWGALAGMASLAGRRARAWLGRTARETLGPFRAGFGPGATRTAAVYRLFALLLLPFLVVVLVFRYVLGALGAVLVAALFLVGLVAAGLVFLSSRLLSIVLRLPLYLFEKGFEALRRAYGFALTRSLRFSAFILAGVALLAIHSGFIAAGLGQELIPTLRQGEFRIRMEAPPGTRLEVTEQRASAIERLALAVPEVETVAVQVGMEESQATGNRGENIALFTVRLQNPEENVVKQDAIVAALRDRIAQVTPDTIAFEPPPCSASRRPSNSRSAATTRGSCAGWASASSPRCGTWKASRTPS